MNEHVGITIDELVDKYIIGYSSSGRVTFDENPETHSLYTGATFTFKNMDHLINTLVRMRDKMIQLKYNHKVS